MLKFYVRHGLIVDKFHEIISFEQKKWWEKCRNCNTENKNLAKKVFEKDFYNLLKNAFHRKTMENVRNRNKSRIYQKKNRNEKIFKQQSKLTFNVIHKSYTNYGSYSFKQIEVLLDKPIYVGFALLELSTLIMYKTYYNIQPFFG